MDVIKDSSVLGRYVHMYMYVSLHTVHGSCALNNEPVTELHVRTFLGGVNYVDTGKTSTHTCSCTLNIEPASN